jgi:hypothetical protein
MALAARDYLSTPAAYVSVERKLNSGRDIMGIRRQSLGNDTFRMLILLLDRVRQLMEK